MYYDWETIFTISWLALWFLFPLGIFLSVGRLDKNSDELEQIVKLRRKGVVKVAKKISPKKGFHLPQWGLRH